MRIAFEDVLEDMEVVEDEDSKIGAQRAMFMVPPNIRHTITNIGERPLVLQVIRPN